MTGPARELELLVEGPVGREIGSAPPGFTPRDWRAIRSGMKKKAQQLSHRGRVSRCGQPLTTRPPTLEDARLFDFPPPPMLADVEVHRVNGRAEFRGLQTCGSPWECTTCAERIARENAELLNVAAAVTRRRGGGVYTATLTIRHSVTMELAPLNHALHGAWRRVLQGTPWQRTRKRYGLVGYVKAIEVTYGAAGWHPHLHIGFYTDRRLTKRELESFEQWLAARWRRFIIAQNPGVNIVPNTDAGVRIRKLHKDDYLAKFGLGGELAKGFVKRAGDRNRTPWQILYDLSRGAGSQRDLWTWREYTLAMFREHPLRWSPGLKTALDLQRELETWRADERADARLAGRDLEDAHLLSIDGRTWAAHIAGEPLELELAELVESGADPPQLELWLDQQLGRSPPVTLVTPTKPRACQLYFL